MQQDFISGFSQYSKTAMNSARELMAINGRAMERLLDSQIGLAKLCVETGEKQLGVIEHLENPAELLSKEAALLEEYSSKFADAARTRMQITQETAEELRGWFAAGLKVADAAVKETQNSVTTSVDVPVPVEPATPKAKKAPAKKSAAKKPASE